MPRTGYCTDMTCSKELTELYECHCCSWLVCLKHLLEHVEVAQRDKKERLDGLKTELETALSSLEMIVDKKVQEIEQEKRLITQAKSIFNKANNSIEEIQILSEEVNQAIVANRKEETIVKVEPTLSDMKLCLCNQPILNENSSASNQIFQQPLSPVYRPFRINLTTKNREIDDLRSSTPKRTHQSPDDSDEFHSADSLDHENLGSRTKKLKAHPNYVDRYNTKGIPLKCPFTFHGAFGLDTVRHSINICPESEPLNRNLGSHLRHKHNLKKEWVKALYSAVKSGLDPKTTILFNSDGELKSDLIISCPFSNKTIHLIGYCPTSSRSVPCQQETIYKWTITSHLRDHHRVQREQAAEISKTYLKKLDNKLD